MGKLDRDGMELAGRVIDGRNGRDDDGRDEAG